VVWAVVRVLVRSVSVRVLTGEWNVPKQNHKYCKILRSRLLNEMISARTRASAVTDRLRYGKGNRECVTGGIGSV
jgi:hypothetical protein